MALQEETETLTIRLPKGLKGLVEEAARSRSMSVTAIVRESLQNCLSPSGTPLAGAGLTPEFQAFLDSEEPGSAQIRHVLILVREPRGAMYFFKGSIERGASKHGIVTIADHRRRWVIPRQDIVAWVRTDQDELDRMAESLIRQGWAPRSS